MTRAAFFDPERLVADLEFLRAATAERYAALMEGHCPRDNSRLSRIGERRLRCQQCHDAGMGENWVICRCGHRPPHTSHFVDDYEPRPFDCEQPS